MDRPFFVAVVVIVYLYNAITIQAFVVTSTRATIQFPSPTSCATSNQKICITSCFPLRSTLTTRKYQRNTSILYESFINGKEEKLEQQSELWRRKDLFGESLVNQTIESMQNDPDFLKTSMEYTTKGAAAISKEERTRRRRALNALGIPNFEQFVHVQSVANHKSGSNTNMNTNINTNSMKENNVISDSVTTTTSSSTSIRSLQRRDSTILQLNIGLYCNQACAHCHVESSPLRTEMMTSDVAARCLELLQHSSTITTLDITGGAPELNMNFRYLVSTARLLCPHVEIIDRCNLTVLQEPGQEDLIDFLKQNKVRIVASLPCYSETTVDQQRGKGVFERSIAALLALNDAGYGIPESDLILDLVYNPSEAILPPPQETLEVQYKAQLADNFGILFNELFTITNMPIKRFADYLHRRHELESYMKLLVDNYNAETMDSLMCRDTISVGYDGKLYDCDFNQQLGYGISVGPNDEFFQGGLSVFDVESLSELTSYSIRTDNHCFGCTAGMGSSCQGTTVS